MERSRHSRSLRISWTCKHRWRQIPQRKSRLPSRSMYTSMHSSVSSTLVTVWAFKRNCFLIKVSMSTSVRVLSYSLVGNTKLTRCRGAAQIPVNPQLQTFQGLQLPLHFSDRNPKFGTCRTAELGNRTHSDALSRMIPVVHLA